MPSFVHSKSSRVAVGAYNLSSITTEVAHQHTVETADTTPLTSSDMTYMAGRVQHTVNLKGVADFALLSDDAGAIEGILGSTTRGIVSYLPEGYTVGKQAQLMQGTPTAYNRTSPASDVVRFDAALAVTHSTKSDHGTAVKDSNGVVLFYSAAASTSTQAQTTVDQSAASAAGYAAHLHVFSGLGGGNVTLQVQHSSNGSAWSDLTAFTSVTAFQAQRLTSWTAAVKRYVRGAITVANSTAEIEALVTFARR